ncbi:hypothetical protein [Streptomyces sp. URMC 129]|uniref:hypothetical protein n=1 Tax=Streptomyces sp. URMC 129 TaxID=3423407 RepID=UPI003F1BEC8F
MIPPQPPLAVPLPSPPPPRTAGEVGFAVVWRALIVLCAFTGLNAAMSASGDPWSAGSLLPLSQFASLVAGCVYALLAVADLAAGTRRPEPPSAWVRGLLMMTLCVVMITWFTVMGGDVSETWSLFEHLLTPLAVLGDWLFVGRRQAYARWWYPLSWLGPLLLYVLVLVTSEHNPYEFLDPDDDGFAGYLTGTGLGVLAGGLLLVAVARRRRPEPAAAVPPFPPGPYGPPEPHGAPVPYAYPPAGHGPGDR